MKQLEIINYESLEIVHELSELEDDERNQTLQDLLNTVDIVNERMSLISSSENSEDYRHKVHALKSIIITLSSPLLNDIVKTELAYPSYPNTTEFFKKIDAASSDYAEEIRTLVL